MNLRKQVQELATGLIDHARTSYELEVLLNHNPDGKPWIPGENQTLERLKLAIDYNQKKFVTHPSVQQLLAAIWYEGLPGFRRLHIVRQALCVLKLACSFPLYSLAYLFLPQSSWGQYAKKPFFKFTCNSASYIFFLFLLTLASQRVEYIVIDLLGMYLYTYELMTRTEQIIVNFSFLNPWYGLAGRDQSRLDKARTWIFAYIDRDDGYHVGSSLDCERATTLVQRGLGRISL